MGIETTYGDKIQLRREKEDPVKQQVEEIKSRVYDQQISEFKAAGSAQMTGLGLNIPQQQVNWEMARSEGADFSAEVPYKYLTADAPQRYLWGMDMATGTPPDLVGDVEALISTAPPEDEDDSNWLWDIAKGMRQGGVAAVVNAARIIRDNVSPFTPVDIHDDRTRELLTLAGVDPSAWLELPYERRMSILRTTSEAEMQTMIEELAPDTMVGGMASGATQFLMYSIPATRIAKGALGAVAALRHPAYLYGQPLGYGAAAADILGGAAASLVAWEHGEPTVFNLMQKFEMEGLSGVVVDYLASDKDDSWFENALKQVSTDVVMNAAMRGAFRSFAKGVKSLRHSPLAKAAAMEIDGYIKAANLHKTRGSFSLGPVRAADSAEIDVWSQIIGGKYAKGQINKKQFMEGGKDTFDEDTLGKIWDRAKSMSTEIRTSIRRLVGAPPRIRNVQLRDDFVDILSLTLENRHTDLADAASWWDTSGAAIKELAAGDSVMEEKLLRLFALYGQDASVGANVTGVLQSLEELASATPAARGRYPGKLRRADLEALLDTEKPWLADTPGVGDKLRSYYQNLSDATRGQDMYPDTVTIDTWMGRLLGYKNLPKGQQYRWSAQMINDVTKRTNEALGTSYKPREVQSMLWQLSKNVWTKQSRTGKVATFSSELRRRTSYIPWEAAPAPETGALADFNSWPRPKQRQYTEWVGKIINNPDGSSKIAEKFGIKGLRYRETNAFGTWENNFNPNRVGKLRDAATLAQYDPKQAELMSLAYQYVNRQHSTMWWKPSPTGPTETMMFKLKSSANQDVARKVYAAAKAVDPKAEGTFLNGEFHFLNVAETDDFIKKMYSVMDDPEIKELLDVPSSGDYQVEVFWNEHNWKTDPKGDAILSEIAARGRRDVLPWLRDLGGEVENLAKAVEGKLKKFDFQDEIF